MDFANIKRGSSIRVEEPGHPGFWGVDPIENGYSVT